MHAAHMRKGRLFTFRSSMLSTLVASPLFVVGVTAVIMLRGSVHDAHASVFVEHGIPISAGTPSSSAPAAVAAPVRIVAEPVSRIAPSAHLPNDPLASIVVVDRGTGLVRVFGKAESETSNESQEESPDEDRGEENLAIGFAEATSGLVERARFIARENRDSGESEKDEGAWEVFATQDVSALQIVAWSVSAPEEKILRPVAVRGSRRKRHMRNARARARAGTAPTTRLRAVLQASKAQAIFGINTGEPGAKGAARFVLAPADFHALSRFILSARTPIVLAPTEKSDAAVSDAAAVSIAAENSNSNSVVNSVEEWRVAWQNAAFADYEKFYPVGFSPLGQSRRAWIAQKKRTARAERAGRSIALSEPVVIAFSNRAYAFFLQRYEAGRRKDFGLKLLTLARTQESSSWDIAAESWRPADPIALARYVDAHATETAAARSGVRAE